MHGTTGEKLLVLYSAFPSLPNLVSPTLPQGVIITLKLYNKNAWFLCKYSLLINFVSPRYSRLTLGERVLHVK